MYRKTPLRNGEIYHLYNRGVDKRVVFQDAEDFKRFFQSMEDFNNVETLGSLYEQRFNSRDSQLGSEAPKLPLVEIIAYCLNDNHYHFLVKQLEEDGISKWTQKLGTGYTNYFNEKNQRTGALFEGPYKAKHVDTNEYLLLLSAYINLNDHVHGITTAPDGVNRSSFDAFLGGMADITCVPGIVIDQFGSLEAYQLYAQNTADQIEKDRDDRDLSKDLMHE